MEPNVSIETILNAPEHQKLIGVYAGRSNGKTLVLTAPCARQGQRYALFELPYGMMLYVPLENTLEPAGKV